MEQSVELAAAYADCRAIAKREAKNFYYGFMALPRAKSDAMCAMYAFMRRADDISDDESQTVEARRERMERWLAAFHQCGSVEAQDSAVFLAVRDVQQRFGVPDTLLDELVQGTAMDLLAELPAGVQRVSVAGKSFDVYQTVEALDRYCYLVASVVGLVTIRIFGFTEERANGYAIDLGKAFQLTNILRDVQEDAQRGRIYLPKDVLLSHGSTAADVDAAAESGQASAALHSAMQSLAARAEQLYSVEAQLIPLLDRDSRPAMRVLVTIYHALLKEIQAEDYDVFRRRVQVSTARKITILLRGLLSRWVAV